MYYKEQVECRILRTVDRDTLQSVDSKVQRCLGGSG